MQPPGTGERQPGDALLGGELAQPRGMRSQLLRCRQRLADLEERWDQARELFGRGPEFPAAPTPVLHQPRLRQRHPRRAATHRNFPPAGAEPQTRSSTPAGRRPAAVAQRLDLHTPPASPPATTHPGERAGRSQATTSRALATGQDRAITCETTTWHIHRANCFVPGGNTCASAGRHRSGIRRHLKQRGGR